VDIGRLDPEARSRAALETAARTVAAMSTEVIEWPSRRRRRLAVELRASRSYAVERVLLGWINAAVDHVAEPSRSNLRACRPARGALQTSTPRSPPRRGRRPTPFGLHHRGHDRGLHSPKLNARPDRHSSDVVSRLHVIFTMKWPSAAVFATTTPASAFNLIPINDMLLRGKLPQRFQKGTNRRPCGLNRLVEARLGLKHPDLAARDVLRADVRLGDLHEHWACPVSN
jgi:hypothetical protein